MLRLCLCHSLQSVSHTHLTGKANKNTWKLLCNPVMLEPRDRRTALITLKAKPLALFSQEIWSMGQLKSRPQTKSLTYKVAQELLLLLYPSKNTKSQPHLLLNTDFSPPNQGALQNTWEAASHITQLCLTVELEQKAQPIAFPDCRGKQMASPDQDIQSALFV